MSRPGRRDHRAQRLRFESLEVRRVLSTVTVSTNSDVTDGNTASIALLIANPGPDGKISLREAIDAAQFTNGNDAVDFSSGLNAATITLTQGELTISDTAALTIDASNLSSLTIDASGNDLTPGTNDGQGSRIFNITDPTFGSSPPLVTMKNLTLTGGDVTDNGGAIWANETRLVLENCTIESNSALVGGGITVWANNITGNDLNYLTLRNTRIQNNTAVASGGIDVQAFNAEISILQSSSISGNTVSGSFGRGGGLSLTMAGYSQVDISDSSISQNSSSGDAGGMFVTGGGELTINRTTISGNTSVVGAGGMWINRDNGSLTIADSKIELNKTTGFQSGNNVPFGAGANIDVANSSVTIGRTEFTRNLAEGLEDNVGGLGVIARGGCDILFDRVGITENHADGDVGGMYFDNLGNTFVMQYCTISGNTANNNAVSGYDSTGGVFIRTLFGGSTTIKYSTISDNEISGAESPNEAGKRGGGLFLINGYDSTTTILNSTISGNKADGSGGGIKVASGSAGNVNIRHSTIYNNRADLNDDSEGTGGGIDVGSSPYLTLMLNHTIVAGNWRGTGTTRDDISGPVTVGWSLIGDNTGATITPVSGTTNQIGTGGSPINPNLAPLAWNGGPTMTHALLSGSPAIDAGNPSAVAGVGDVPLNDQRGEGFPRVADVPGVNGSTPRIDIGAYEIGLAKVIDVILNGVMVDQSNAPWERDPISYATEVPLGSQLAPIYTEGVNSIQIAFSEEVSIDVDSLKLYRTGGRHDGQLTNPNPTLEDVLTLVAPLTGSAGFNYDSTTQIATWTFPIFAADKYRIVMMATDVIDMGGNQLDGEWLNLTNGTPDIFESDPKGRVFLSGNGTAGGNFDFLLSYLPGDYDRNGVVDALDEELLATGSDFDGNGDGVETSADHDVWSDHDGEQLKMRRAFGDYNDDEATGAADYSVWRSTYGSMSDLRADGNGDLVIDAADFILWRYWEDTRGAWYEGFSGFGAMLPIVDFENAPTVTNVTISGSNSTHAAYSFDAHDGSGEQLKTVPVGGADTISITFSEDVNVVAGNLRLVGLRTFNVPTVAEFSYDIGTMTATWRFDDLVANDHYLISLSDAVTDIEGNRLDGEWVNPVSTTTTNSLVSEFPSGDGNAGGHFNFVVTLLAGDFNLNNIVNTGDETIYWTNYLYILSDAEFIDGDASGDGGVGDDDVDLLYGTLLLDLNDVQLYADLDGDFDVDDDDLAILDDNLGMSSPTYEDGDFDGDGDVDAADLDLMFAQYGLQIAVVS